MPASARRACRTPARRRLTACFEAPGRPCPFSSWTSQMSRYWQRVRHRPRPRNPKGGHHQEASAAVAVAAAELQGAVQLWRTWRHCPKHPGAVARPQPVGPAVPGRQQPHACASPALLAAGSPAAIAAVWLAHGRSSWLVLAYPIP
eukprot:scaffold243901_cov31-Tisochrysis_lutea.AAC.2